jgi:hypothetical protein
MRVKESTPATLTPAAGGTVLKAVKILLTAPETPLKAPKTVFTAPGRPWNSVKALLTAPIVVSRAVEAALQAMERLLCAVRGLTVEEVTPSQTLGEVTASETAES